MPRRVGAEVGERGFEEGQMEGGLSLQIGWEARSFVETGPRAVYKLWILEHANSTGSRLRDWLNPLIWRVK